MAVRTRDGRRQEPARSRRGSRAHARIRKGKQDPILAALLASMSGAAMVVRKRDGQVIEVNARWEEQSGIAREKAVGRTTLSIGLWADLAVRAEFLRDLETNGSVEDRLVRLRRPDGSMRDVLLSGTVVDVDGEPHIVASSRDMTERLEAERRLQASERKLTSIFQRVLTPIVISRRRDGVIIEVNEAWERATGIARERAIGKPGTAVGHWNDQAARERIVARVDALGQVDDEMVTFARPDGAVRDVLVSCQRIEWDGEPHLLWSSRDVTELRQAQRKFATLFETNPVGLVVTRPRDRRVVEVNDVALDMIGLTRAEAIGAGTLDVVRILNLPEIEALRVRGLAGQRVRGPVHFERRDGRRVEAIVTGGLTDIGGEPHFVFSLLDVTEQRRIERERLQAERKFAALFEDSPEPISLFRISDGVR